MNAIEIEPDFDVVLVSTGINRLRVAILVRQFVKASPKEILAQIDSGEILIASDVSHFQAYCIKDQFEKLGAILEIRLS